MNPKDEVKFEDIKKLVFSSLKELTKEEYPWGILVGIRPSKIALKYLEEGKEKKKGEHK